MTDLINTANSTFEAMETVMDLLKQVDRKKYENIKWALEWNMMTLAEAMEYIKTGIWAA